MAAPCKHQYNCTNDFEKSWFKHETHFNLLMGKRRDDKASRKLCTQMTKIA